MRTALALLALLLAAPWVMAQTIDLTYAPEPGEAVQYTATIEGLLDLPQADGLAIKASTAYSVQVLEDEAEEGFVHEVVLGATEASIGTEKLPSAGEGKAAKIALDPRGLMVKVIEALPAELRDGADGIGQFAFLARDLMLPAKEVAVGDTWETTQTDGPSIMAAPNGIRETGEVTAKTTLVSLEDGVATLETEFSAKGDLGGYQTTLEGKTTLRLDTGTWTILDAETTLSAESRQGPGDWMKLRDVKVKLRRAE
jgi:hypothetical protein